MVRVTETLRKAENLFLQNPNDQQGGQFHKPYLSAIVLKINSMYKSIEY